MNRIRIAEKLSKIPEPWQPKIVAELNGQHVKLAKLAGDFVWHRHEAEDELFLVVAGRLRMDFRDRQIWLEEGEMIVVPRGVEHKPFSPEGCSVMLFEPAGTLNTGDIRNERTVDSPERL
jgi:mannose-6-phosphate isomerase-like protein (cupin superfamily)